MESIAPFRVILFVKKRYCFSGRHFNFYEIITPTQWCIRLHLNECFVIWHGLLCSHNLYWPPLCKQFLIMKLYSATFPQISYSFTLQNGSACEICSKGGSSLQDHCLVNCGSLLREARYCRAGKDDLCTRRTECPRRINFVAAWFSLLYESGFTVWLEYAFYSLDYLCTHMR